MYDGAAVTAKARQAFRDSFLDGHACKVCPEVLIPADLPLEERQRRGDALHRMHYVRVRLGRSRKAAGRHARTSPEAAS